MHEILLEAGTNEVEFLEFYLGDQSFGINVAKVKQMVRYEADQITALPDQIPSMLGSLHHLGHHVPILDLNRHLHRQVTETKVPRIIILTDFNSSLSGYLVDGVNKIHRINWTDFQPTSPALQMHNPRVTGMVVLENREIAILDFECILEDVQGAPQLDAAESEQAAAPPVPTAAPGPPPAGVSAEALAATAMWRNAAAPAPTTPAVPAAPAPKIQTPAPSAQAPAPTANEDALGPSLYLAEDSNLFRMNLISTLHHWNYRNLAVFENGLVLFRHLEKRANEAINRGGGIKDVCDLVITDIEMPQMDGLTLCRNLKSLFPSLPVIVLSSLITEQMALKCQSVNADANLSKKQLGKLKGLIETFIAE
ncbi:chemotaxis protein [Acanthopleuribacter pedis]|uniref:Chemotaxis protein CheV n=1 Tax=Acanthopleuribacter pedis TaxID=442870 RepID=A0A8J7Q7Q3_9BACT|nr:chemotaxis protein [Acanthopleuribacter pedis]MBO1318379.1 chemotaxis protein CheV [Acanthopleuribacter pedis]